MTYSYTEKDGHSTGQVHVRGYIYFQQAGDGINYDWSLCKIKIHLVLEKYMPKRRRSEVDYRL